MEVGSGDFPIFALCLAGSISPISLRWSPEVGRILRIVDVEAMAPPSPSHESLNMSMPSSSVKFSAPFAMMTGEVMPFMTFKVRS